MDTQCVNLMDREDGGWKSKILQRMGMTVETREEVGRLGAGTGDCLVSTETDWFLARAFSVFLPRGIFYYVANVVQRASFQVR